MIEVQYENNIAFRVFNTV